MLGPLLSPDEIEALRDAVRQAQRASSAALIGALLLQLTSLPWSLSSGLLAAIGAAYGIRALRLGGRLRRAGIGVRGRGATAVGLGLASLLVLQGAVQVAIFDIQWDYQKCREAAQTDTAREACDAEHDRRLKP